MSQFRHALWFLIAILPAILALPSGPAHAQTVPGRIGPADTVSRYLSVLSTPVGCDVYLDGEFVGTTPYGSTTIEYGVHVVELRMEGFASVVDTITVRYRTPVRISRHLMMLGAIQVTSDPQGANVFLADTIAGMTPLSLSGMRPGRTPIRVNSPEYSEFNSRIVIPESSTVSVHVKLVAAYGMLNIRLEGPDAMILLDGDTLGRGSLEPMKVPVGRHELSFRSNVSELERNSTIHILPRGFVEVHAEVDKPMLTPVLMSFILPGSGQALYGRSTRGTLILGAFLGSVGATATSHYSFMKARDTYNDARTSYLLEAIDERRLIELRKNMIGKRGDAEAARTRTYVFGGIAAAIYVYNLLDVLVFNDTFIDVSHTMHLPEVAFREGDRAIHFTAVIPL